MRENERSPQAKTHTVTAQGPDKQLKQTKTQATNPPLPIQPPERRKPTRKLQTNSSNRPRLATRCFQPQARRTQNRSRHPTLGMAGHHISGTTLAATNDAARGAYPPLLQPLDGSALCWDVERVVFAAEAAAATTTAPTRTPAARRRVHPCSQIETPAPAPASSENPKPPEAPRTGGPHLGASGIYGTDGEQEPAKLPPARLVLGKGIWSGRAVCCWGAVAKTKGVFRL